jgi:hypothetical protein
MLVNLSCFLSFKDVFCTIFFFPFSYIFCKQTDKAIKKHPQKTFCGCFLLIVIQFCQLCLGPVAIKSGVQKSRLPIYKKNEHETESSLPSAITLSASIKQ